MPLKKFPNKRVVITGANSGLGRALALEFADLGWKILISVNTLPVAQNHSVNMQ
jgi:NAD(P)-dependent dehydrogenase (short-subunit alcohol dehydrogenase family)